MTRRDMIRIKGGKEMKHPEGICQECNVKVAHYKMYRTRGGVKEWIGVCIECEGKIGMENLERAKLEASND